MDCDTGRIYQIEGDTVGDRVAKQRELVEAFVGLHDRQLLQLTEDQAKELMPLSKKMRKNNMRNKPCICGSGVKFKRCCWSKYI